MNTFYFNENLNESVVTDFKDKFGDELFNEYQSVKNTAMAPTVKAELLNLGVEEGAWNDVSYWMPKTELELADFIDNVKIAVQNRDDKRERRHAGNELSKFTYLDDHEGADLIYNDDQWEVYDIHTIDASKHIGSNTRWCTTGSHEYRNKSTGEVRTSTYFFNEYTSFCRLYYYIDKVNHHKYAAIIPPHGYPRQLWNDANDTINEIPDEPYIRGISDLDTINIEVVYEDDTWRLEKVINTIQRGDITNVCKLNSDYSTAYMHGFNKFADEQHHLFSAREYANLGEDERNLILNYYIPAGIFTEDDID